MKKMMHRRDITEKYNISRRVIEGYESYELIRPSEKDKYGHNLYDKETVKRIGLIRLYQEMGFGLKEIKEFIDEKPERVKEILNKQIEVLERKSEDLKSLIVLARITANTVGEIIFDRQIGSYLRRKNSNENN